VRAPRRRAPLASTLASTLVWVARAAILVLVIAALAAVLFAMLTPPRPPCSSIDAESITEEAVEALRAEGWYPDPTDGYERLLLAWVPRPGERRVSRDAQAKARNEARASQWARIEEVAALPPALRERLYTVLLDAVPHLAAEKQLFRAVSTVLGAVIEYNESTRKRS